jgi:hypothetical protein
MKFSLVESCPKLLTRSSDSKLATSKREDPEDINNFIFCNYHVSVLIYKEIAPEG